MMRMQYFFLIFIIKAYAVDTHLNCLDLSRTQMSTRNICFYKVDKSTWAEIG